MAKAVLINPNNGAIDTRYDPNDIDAPHSYRARDGFMGIGPLWANNDDGTVYMQGHVVIPNPWGDAVTHGTTTTTTDDTTDKDGGDDEGDGDKPCGPVNPCAGKAKDYCFSYASIEYVPIDVDSDGNLIFIGQLAKSQKERFRDAGFSEKTIFMTGILGGECIGVMGGSMTCCTPVICPDGTCGLKCECKVNGKWEEIKAGVDGSGRTC
jgi:hypothetical protein